MGLSSGRLQALKQFDPFSLAPVPQFRCRYRRRINLVCGFCATASDKDEPSVPIFPLRVCGSVEQLQPKALSLRRQDDGGAVNLIASSHPWLRPGVSLSGNFGISLSRFPHKTHLLLGFVSANLLPVQCAGVPELQPDAFRVLFVSFVALERMTVAHNAAFEFAFASFPPGLVPGDYIADSKYGIEKGIGLFMVLFGDKGNPAGNWVPFVFVLCAFRLTPLFSRLSGFLP